ncbi:LysE/ArgO family amino acid transporter [Microvirga pudoricolor]|uniref:LysE/ArgO family amino acid transporter n=1 Tax=Microvirga pudoricolor TaxID=2778729 RepID=UPI00194F8292|nr:LysE family transporter [Microvirga pudoricolor]MBM6594609.1 LysE family transporter [Microvirga pudoricolor]
MSISSLIQHAGTAGFMLGVSFIFSIGPQNLRLLQAGFTRRHEMTVATVGFVSEVVIVVAGQMVFETAMTTAPALAGILQALGIGFLAWCGVKSLAQRSQGGLAAMGELSGDTRLRAVMSMLAVTWLNPLLYLEALFLLGVLASTYDSAERSWFFVGYLAAAAIKFYGLSFAGRAVSPWLSRPGWRAGFDSAAGTLLIGTALLMSWQLLPGGVG